MDDNTPPMTTEDETRPAVIEKKENGSSEQTHRFAQPSEEEFARILDFYGLLWA